MSQDESKFDTMRLIAGAEASDLYSLEDIVREFTDSGAQPEETEQPEQPEQNEPATDAPEQKAASSEDEPKNAASEAEETPDASEENEAAEQEDELPIDQNQQPPAYENLSESQMADAIAQAVAHSIEVDTAAPVIVQAEQLPKEQEKPAESAAQPKPGSTCAAGGTGVAACGSPAPAAGVKAGRSACVSTRRRAGNSCCAKEADRSGEKASKTEGCRSC